MGKGRDNVSPGVRFPTSGPVPCEVAEGGRLRCPGKLLLHPPPCRTQWLQFFPTPRRLGDREPCSNHRSACSLAATPRWSGKRVFLVPFLGQAFLPYQGQRERSDAGSPPLTQTLNTSLPLFKVFHTQTSYSLLLIPHIDEHRFLLFSI